MAVTLINQRSAGFTLRVIDSETFKLLTERDQVFLEKLFIDTNPYLLKLLAANKVFAETAQDLIQSSWETFFKNLEKFEGKSQIKVFLAGILLNKLREHRRLQYRVVYAEDSQEIFDTAFTQDGWWNLEPEDPHKLMESKEVLKFIEECIEGLSDSQRDAFVLRAIENEESENICNILGVSVSNLGVLLFRAKDKLKKCLEGKIK